jgi:hypothetical protein
LNYELSGGGSHNPLLRYLTMGRQSRSLTDSGIIVGRVWCASFLQADAWDDEFGVAFVAIDPEVTQQLASLWSARASSGGRVRGS